MQVVHFIYQDQEIDFLPSGENVMVNATQMAKIFGKRIDHFLKADHVSEFIKALELTLNGGRSSDRLTLNGARSGDEFPPNGGNSSYEFTPNGGNSFSENTIKIISTHGQSGTFFHRLLALKFAAWLDPHFEVWVFRMIDKIILREYQELREATIQKLVAQNELKRKKAELINKHPELADIFELELKVTRHDRERAKILKATTQQLQLKLFPEMN